MGDIMCPIPFDQLMKWIMSEYRGNQSIFGIEESQFFRKTHQNTVNIFGEDADTALGPAAGPHTQLSQNIITAYLVGGRFLELKTVQKLDTLEIEKPCIDARDEGYNTEWSTELTLKQAISEYINAWFALHVLEYLFDLSSSGKRSFIFNMSFGYDLEGIQLPKMQEFVDGMIDASNHPVFQNCVKQLEVLASDPEFLKGTGLEGKDLTGLAAGIPPNIASSVTLSTMHGCPPDEIEAICKYALTDKKLNTYVKLNPTLLGYHGVREILDRTGFEYISLSREAFSHDLSYDRAVPMLKRLVQVAKDEGLQFGIKLSNTLGGNNTLGVLPGGEFYMSGRALFPLTINVAARISQDFNGEMPISYSGGATQLNVKDLYETGIMPVTLATDLLKPGGYLRMKEMAGIMEDIEPRDRIDVAKLSEMASDALGNILYKKSWRGTDRAAIDEELPLFDCYAAPCTLRCPIHQDVPEYIRLVSEERYDEALELIYAKNPLPHITGYICDHQCMFTCTRLDYEGSVRIRDIKLLATNKGWDSYMARYNANVAKNGVKVAVIGAGPAGLGTAYFLSLGGYEVTVLERATSAGGVATNVLPSFRLPAEAIQQDIDFIKRHGVEFKFGVPEEFSVSELQKQGYKYVFIGVGAQKTTEMKLTGDNKNIHKSLEFLRTFKEHPGSLKMGKSVAVVGGGNTAMDGARAATRIPGVEKVAIVYRRTKEQMPADMEEFDNALAEGVEFMPLLLPENFSSAGVLTCRKMELGEPDASGRRRPVATGETVDLQVDSLITAIGEKVDTDLLEKAGLKRGEDGWIEVNKDTLESSVPNVFIGGDAFRGPSTVVESLADARTASESIIRKEDPEWQGFDMKENLKDYNLSERQAAISAKRGKLIPDHPKKIDEALGQLEAQRCLECHIICNKCVSVCPNRANVAISMGNGNFKDPYQILHLDALCNECGNCGVFCPYNGKPYKDKMTLFVRQDDFENSENNGFIFTEGDTKGSLRLNKNLYDFTVDAQGSANVNASDVDAATLLTGVQQMIQAVRKDYGFYLITV